VPGLADVRSTLQRGNTEISLKLDREKLAALSLEFGLVTKTLAQKVQGEVPTRYPERDRKIDISVRREQDEIASVPGPARDQRQPARHAAGAAVERREVRVLEGPSEIRRLGNVRGAEVMAALTGFDLGTTQERVKEALAQVSLPAGVEVRLGGQKEEMERSLNSLALALALAIFLVYFVMASQFESIVQPLVILLAMPLALVGVVFVLEALAVPVSVIVLLGAIVLAGVVVTNAIVLIDQINQCREAGDAKFKAIVEGAHRRLRPVMMTTLTTLLGLLPMTGWLAGIPWIGGTAEGLELRAPMAITLIAGLSSSTLLTLVVIPVAYSFADRRR
jgi:HAE1 family hydrophobic/amphiphilic exporter-1